MNIDIYNKILLENKPDIDVLMKAARQAPDDPEFLELKAVQRARKAHIHNKDVTDAQTKYQTLFGIIQNTDGSGDYDGDIYVSRMGLRALDVLPPLRIVTGTFDCSDNWLNTLEGAPKECKNFYCFSNSLYTLKGAPEKCVVFDCMVNYLETLEGGPTICHQYYNCNSNELISLEGAPNKCDVFDCSSNKLRSLKGGPVEYSQLRCGNNAVSEEQLLREHERGDYDDDYDDDDYDDYDDTY